MYTFFSNKYPGYFTVPVRIFGPNKSIVVESMVDTGSWSVMDGVHAIDLQLDKRDAFHTFKRGDETFYLYRLPIQIGNLDPVEADIYFGSKAAMFSYLKKSALEIGTIGWANNGGLNKFIIDMDIKNIAFTDFRFINSLPTPFNNYTVLSLSPPRIATTGYKEEILSNQQPYHDITFFNKITGAPVTIKMLIDTGATWTFLRNELAPQLGIDVETGGKKMTARIQGKPFVYYIHDIVMKLGSLAPKKISVQFGEMEYQTNLFGQDNLYKYNVRFMKDKILYEENPSSMWWNV